MSSVETEGSDSAPPVWLRKLAALLTDSLQLGGRDGNTEAKTTPKLRRPTLRACSALVDDFRPRRRLEREEPVAKRPVPPHVRERVAGPVPRLVEQLRPLDRKLRRAQRQRYLGQCSMIRLRHEPESVRAAPAGRGRRDERRRKERFDAVAPREQAREQPLFAAQ